MKNKILLITTIFFFILVNTGYYWMSFLGGWSIILIFSLVIVFIVLAISLIVQLVNLFEEKSNVKQRMILVVIMILVLTLTILFPRGLFNFEKLEGEDLLIAGREGAANCMTTINFKSNNQFRERDVCFAIMVKKGKYYFENDTIKFEKSGEENPYQFAVIRPTIAKNKLIKQDLLLYRNIQDTQPQILFISYNKLTK